MAERTSSIIERRPVVSHKNFFRQYEAGLGTPVVFTDVVKQWPAYDKWSFEWLKESYGSTNVTIVTGKMDYDVTFQKCEMSLAQYVDALVDRNGSDRFCL